MIVGEVFEGLKMVEANCYCPSTDVVDLAVDALKENGVIVAPTDTVYGLLADPFNPKAVERVYRVKRRDPGKPLPLLLGETHHALLLVEPSPIFWRLAMAFWPGPLTIVEKPSPNLPSHLKPWGNIGVRLPKCPLVREIARRMRGVLIGTSANKSGHAPPRTAYDASVQLGDVVDLYIDAGPTPLGAPSTVVDIAMGKPVVLREGPVSAGEVMRVIGEG